MVSIQFWEYLRISTAVQCHGAYDLSYRTAAFLAMSAPPRSGTSSFQCTSEDDAG
jgi:hypothetical protein